jgi:hypothetical protein
MTPEQWALLAEIREDLYAIERKIDALFSPFDEGSLGEVFYEDRRRFRDCWEYVTQEFCGLDPESSRR